MKAIVSSRVLSRVSKDQ